MEVKGNEIWDDRRVAGYLSHNSDGWMLFTTDHRLVFQAPDQSEVVSWAEKNRSSLLIG